MTLISTVKRILQRLPGEARRLFVTYPIFIFMISSGLAICCLLGVAILQERERKERAPAVSDVPLPRLLAVASPNSDQRPEWAHIDTAIIHVLPDRNFLDLQDRITSTRSLFSVHYSIAPDGTLYEHVQEDKRAWHTKIGLLPDKRKRINAFSVGIGLLRSPNRSIAQSPGQIQTLRALLQQLDKKYTLKYISIHSQVSREVRTDFIDREFPYELFPEYHDRFLGIIAASKTATKKEKVSQ